MAKATKNEFTELAIQVADQIKNNRRTILANAETLMRASLEERRPLNYEELDYLTSEAGFDRQKINEETRRINRLINLQLQAGTTADREKLDVAVADAKAELASRGPELQDKIAKLQAELAGIEKHASTVARRQEEVNLALDGLTKCVPASVTATVSAKRSAIKSTIGRALSDAQIDLKQSQVFLAGPEKYFSLHDYFRLLQKYDRELVTEGLEGSMVRFNYSAKWPAAKAALEAEIPDREKDIELLQAQLDEELAALEKELRQYWR